MEEDTMPTRTNKNFKIVSLEISMMFGFLSMSVQADRNDDSDNIIVEVISAPVIANGLVGLAPTEFNVILNAPEARDQDFALDPELFGHQIPSGGRMEIELGGDITINPDVAADPGLFQTNAHVILTTGPQNPIHGNAGDSVQLGNWSASLSPYHTSSSHLVTITPDGGKGRKGLEGKRARKIGVKVVHIRPRNGLIPFFNGPDGGVVSVAIRIYDNKGKLSEAGFDAFVLRSKEDVGPQAYITNNGVRTGDASDPQPTMEVNEHTNFQRVAPNTALDNITRLDGGSFSDGLPYAPRFLLFKAAGPDDPSEGIVARYEVDATRPWLARMYENGFQIGTIQIKGPSGGNQGSILTDPVATSNIFSVPVQVGDASGVYTVSVRMLGGNESVNTIVVTDDDDHDD